MRQPEPATRRSEAGRALPRLWPLLFPATYLVHIAEELWCGGGFPAWASRFSGVELGEGRFVALNAAAWLVMLVGNAAACAFTPARWLMLPFAAAVLLNGVAHLVGSVTSASYSPGLVSGLLLWVPLGLYTLLRARAFVAPRTYTAAVLLGLVLHGMLTLTAVFG